MRKEVALIDIKKLTGLVAICALTVCSAVSTATPERVEAAEIEVATTAADEVKYMNLSSPSIVWQDEVYLPLRATFADMYMDVHWKVDGSDKVKVNNSYEAYELYLTEDANGLSLKLQTYGAGYPLHIHNGCTYVPMRFFQDVISNYDIGVSGESLLILFHNGGNTASFWKNMNAFYVPAPVVEPEVVAEAVTPTPAVGGGQPTPAVTPVVSTPIYQPVESAVEGNGQLVLPAVSSAYVSSPFGMRKSPWGGASQEWHRGLDLAAANNSSIFSADGGTIIRASWFDSYGNCVDVQHANGMVTRYAHLSSIHVSVGQTVTRGQVIGLMGMTGAATGPHLHFEVILNGTQVDPSPYLGL